MSLQTIICGLIALACFSTLAWSYGGDHPSHPEGVVRLARGWLVVLAGLACLAAFVAFLMFLDWTSTVAL